MKLSPLIKSFLKILTIILFELSESFEESFILFNSPSFSFIVISLKKNLSENLKFSSGLKEFKALSFIFGFILLIELLLLLESYTFKEILNKISPIYFKKNISKYKNSDFGKFFLIKYNILNMYSFFSNNKFALFSSI